MGKEIGMVYVFDLDGTLSNASHRLHHILPKEPKKKKNWDLFFEGIPNDPSFEAMISLVKGLSCSKANSVVLQTGRPEKYRKSTSIWLQKMGLSDSYDFLLMRLNNDHSSNDTVKLRFLEWIYENLNATQENILWFEDSERVVKAINRQGVLALSCQHFLSFDDSIPKDHSEVPGE